MSFAIVCEGRGDKKRLQEIFAFLEQEKLIENDSLAQCTFYEMNGKSNLLNQDYKDYKTLKEDVHILNEFEKVFFLIDADSKINDKKYGGFENTQKELVQLISDLEFEAISDYFICCDPSTKEGYLESLLLSTVPDDIKKCYKDFIDCAKLNTKENHKTTMEQLHRLTKPNQPYDFSHPNFKELNDKLIALFMA